MAGGGSQIIPSLSSSQTHHRGAKGPSKAHLHKPRRAQAHNTRWFWATQIRDPEEDTACLDPSQSCPR